jgi:hypothetical protein
MKKYLVLYTPGLCGTFLTWLINQHNNFPLYHGNMKKYTNDLDEVKTLDIACSGGDWFINKHISKDSDYYMDIDQNGEREWVNTNLDKGESLLIWSFEENRRIRPIDERNNESFTKDCVKINPNHNLVNDDHVSLGMDYVDKELFKRVTDDMQPEKIIVPIYNSSDETLVKRWAIFRQYHKKDCDNFAYWIRIWNEWSDYLVQDNPYGNNVHYVDIEKLTSGDNDEYLKLCEAIDETPIDNIQEDITAYRNILSEVAEQYDRINK